MKIPRTSWKLNIEESTHLKWGGDLISLYTYSKLSKLPHAEHMVK